ncbi:MAG: GWxTD domain-containing protein [Gemmatimonadales bacterium]|nr:GWxTD domain-containing protein [Gemmatimonadales bacterium]
MIPTSGRPTPWRKRSAKRHVALLFFGATAAGSMSAQTPEQRRQADAFQDSLELITDSALLHSRESRLIEAARREQKNAMIHLRLGHLALRRGDLGGAAHYDDAASEFKWAASLEPTWPYAWFGLGLAEFALGARAGGSRDLRPVLARDAWSRAAQAFARAVKLEPGLAPRLEDLAKRAFRARLPERAVVVREALLRAAQETSGPRSARLILGLARVQREMGDDAALGSFETYLASGENRGLGLVELGRTRLLRGDLGGQTQYLDGLATDDPLANALVRADFSMLASPKEMAEFDLRQGPSRVDLVRRFWGIRDRVELRADGERLAEHLRRLVHAGREFLVVDPDGSDRLDDRGKVFVRHGEPDDRAGFSTPGVEPNESWRYRRNATDVVLHFAARRTLNDFRLVESVLDVRDARSESGGGRGFGNAAAPGTRSDQLLRSRAGLSLFYRQLPSSNPAQVADFLTRERALGREGIRIGTGTDSYSLRFQRELGAWGKVIVAGGSGGSPAVQVVFSIPGYAIEPATGVAGIVYPVRVGFVAVDSTGAIVAAVDTVANIEQAERVPANRSLVGRIGVPVRPGHLVVQGAVQYGELSGSAFGVDSIQIPSPGSGTLALGDLLVGSRRGRVLVPLGDAGTIALVPDGVVRRSEGVDLAVEIFGLAPGEGVGLQVHLAPAEAMGGDANAVRWQPFPDGGAEAGVTRYPGADAVTRWRATLPLKKVKPGSWWLAVVVTDTKGQTVRRVSRLVVQAP